MLRTQSPARLLTWLALPLLSCVLLFSACQSTIPRTNPVGQTFPSVEGESLEKVAVTLPPAEPCVLLVGYRQNAQFDADRWLYGFLQAQIDLPIFEVPTLKGLFPRMLGDTIDNGMRKGIPSKDWQSVVTLYGKHADAVAQFTGTEGGRNMRVLLLDAEGQVLWFHDTGYSARVMLELANAAHALAATAE
jgi:hypothetical protein